MLSTPPGHKGIHVFLLYLEHLENKQEGPGRLKNCTNQHSLTGARTSLSYRPLPISLTDKISVPWGKTQTANSSERPKGVSLVSRPFWSARTARYEQIGTLWRGAQAKRPTGRGLLARLASVQRMGAPPRYVFSR